MEKWLYEPNCEGGLSHHPPKHFLAVIIAARMTALTCTGSTMKYPIPILMSIPQCQWCVALDRSRTTIQGCPSRDIRYPAALPGSSSRPRFQSCRRVRCLRRRSAARSISKLVENHSPWRPHVLNAGCQKRSHLPKTNIQSLDPCHPQTLNKFMLNYR